MIAKKEFEDQVAFSTIQLNLYQPSKVMRGKKSTWLKHLSRTPPGFPQPLGPELAGRLGRFAGLRAGSGRNLARALVIGGAVATLLWRVRAQRRKSVSAD
ncbi:hypothetical protein LP420_06085 [Massilia sp. B-10]|nr:hypothetical protein LP420_06085 [Massilia sp. B-10]